MTQGQNKSDWKSFTWSSYRPIEKLTTKMRSYYPSTFRYSYRSIFAHFLLLIHRTISTFEENKTTQTITPAIHDLQSAATSNYPHILFLISASLNALCQSNLKTNHNSSTAITAKDTKHPVQIPRSFHSAWNAR